MKRNILLLSLLFICGCAYLGYLQDPFVDIPNFHRVDEILYRGGQPNQEGLKKLKSIGIKTVISLRGENEGSLLEKESVNPVRDYRETERRYDVSNGVKTLGMNFYNLPMSVYKRPSDDIVLTFLEIVLDRDNQPVFVYCTSGRDRTGAMVAMYRVVVSGWTIKQAYKEAKRLGFWPYRGEAELKNFIHQLKDKRIYFEKAREKRYEKPK